MILPNQLCIKESLAETEADFFCELPTGNRKDQKFLKGLMQAVEILLNPHQRRSTAVEEMIFK